MFVGKIVVIDIQVGAIDVSVHFLVIYFRRIIDCHPTVFPGNTGGGKRGKEKEKNKNNKAT
jgi:hypothetical protein